MPGLTRAGYVPPRGEPLRAGKPPKPSKGKRKKKKKRGMGGVAVFSLMVLLIAVLVGAVTLYIYSATQPYAQAFCPGTLLMGTSLAGKTYEQGEALLEKLTQEDVQGWTYAVTVGESVYTLTAQDAALHVDAARTLEPLWQAGREGGLLTRYLAMRRLEREPVPGMPVIAYSMDAADALLEQLALDTEREPVSATVTYVPGSSEPFRFTAESVGYAVDTAPVRQAIEASLQALEPGEYVLEPTRLEPDVRRSELEAATVLRARVVQEISADEAMLQNARQAAQMLAGVRIEPGKTLSFNRVVGSRTEEAGYVEAQEPAYGTGISGVGGGVCQVSTALYRAALLAGLGIEERHAAVRPMDGCGMGQEAAVSGQGLDLIIRNDTAYPVFVTARVYVDGDLAFCEVQLIGEALGVRYALESQTLDTQTIDEPVYVRDREGRYATYTDERVPVTSGEPGYTVRVERVTLGEGGEELSRETISEDTYDPVAPAIYVGVTERE